MKESNLIILLFPSLILSLLSFPTTVHVLPHAYPPNLFPLFLFFPLNTPRLSFYRKTRNQHREKKDTCGTFTHIHSPYPPFLHSLCRHKRKPYNKKPPQKPSFHSLQLHFQKPHKIPPTVNSAHTSNLSKSPVKSLPFYLLPCYNLYLSPPFADNSKHTDKPTQKLHQKKPYRIILKTLQTPTFHPLCLPQYSIILTQRLDNKKTNPCNNTRESTLLSSTILITKPHPIYYLQP